jgi:hypothetical protein
MDSLWVDAENSGFREAIGTDNLSYVARYNGKLLAAAAGKAGSLATASDVLSGRADAVAGPLSKAILTGPSEGGNFVHWGNAFIFRYVKTIFGLRFRLSSASSPPHMIFRALGECFHIQLRRA